MNEENPLNKVNKLFYTQAERDLIARLPNLFSSLDLFHDALYLNITTKIDSDEIKIKELANGANLDMWRRFIELNDIRHWSVLITDFEKSVLQSVDSLNNVNFDFRLGRENLFEDLVNLTFEERFSVMLSTYTFDTIWLKEDVRLIKENDIWYTEQIEISNLNGAEFSRKLNKDFFRNIDIKKRMLQIDIFSLEYGDEINSFYKDLDSVAINFPGGLINKILQAFDNQLTEKGIFITADFANVIKGKTTAFYTLVNDVLRIKVEDYSIVEYILENLGYKVTLRNLHDFIADSGIETPVEIYDHAVLIVER